MEPTLLLWDIDGTLLTTDRAGEKALFVAVKEVLEGDLGDKMPVDLRGRTDRIIAQDLFTFLKKEHNAEELARFSACYLKNLELFLPKGKGRVLEGVHQALEAAAKHPEIHQALLTGNWRAGAEIKLSFMGLWNHFEFGAFADDSAIRDELGPVALKRAETHLGIKFPPERVVVIGDTPHDVACGKAINAKTIAVASGAFSVKELEACKPSLTLADLSDAEGLISWLEKN